MEGSMSSTNIVELYPSRLHAGGRNRTSFSWRPMLVTFVELGEPASLTVINIEDSERTLGDGYSIKRIYARPSRKPVTKRLSDLLPWFSKFPETGLGRIKPKDGDLGIQIEDRIRRKHFAAINELQ